MFGGKKDNHNQQTVPKQPDNGKSNDVNGLGQGNDKSGNTTPKTPAGDAKTSQSGETKDNGPVKEDDQLTPEITDDGLGQSGNNDTGIETSLDNQLPVGPQPSNPKDQVNGQSQGGLTNEETTPNHLKITNSVTFELTKEAFEKCKTYENPHNKNEVLVYISCNDSEYRITGVPYNKENKVNVNSVAKVENGEVNDKTIVSPANNMEGVKRMLNVSCEESIAVTRLSNEPSKKDKIVVLTNNKIGKKLVASGNLSELTDFQGNPPKLETLLKQLENGKELFYAPELSEFLREGTKKDLERIITFDPLVPSSLFTNTKTEKYPFSGEAKKQ